VLQQALTYGLDAVGLGASDSNQYLIKRVIGLPGDRVSCCTTAGRLQVNGKPMVEPYVLLPPGADTVSSIPFDVTVPKGMAWVMGDNRYNSADSRYHQNDPHHGFVPLTDVVGTAFVITWPINHWTLLNN
jgi:signal peptidase I